MTAESAPMTRAVLGLHVSDGDPDAPECAGCRAECLYCEAGHPWPCPTVQALTAVLAADPEPRDAVIERMARAIHKEQNRGAHWELAADYIHDEYLRLAAVGLDASRGGTQ